MRIEFYGNCLDAWEAIIRRRCDFSLVEYHTAGEATTTVICRNEDGERLPLLAAASLLMEYKAGNLKGFSSYSFNCDRDETRRRIEKIFPENRTPV